MMICIKKISRIRRGISLIPLRTCRNTSAVSDAEFTEDQQNEIDPIEIARDVSRLSERTKVRLHQHAKILPPVYEHELTLRFKRRQYDKFGESSNYDPSIMWPSRGELRTMIEDEKQWDPTFEEMVTKIQADKDAEQKTREDRIAKVNKGMSKMPEYIADYEKRLQDKAKLLQKQEEKKKKLLEDAREFFGYEVDAKDSKFKQLQELKAEEEEKAAKKKKKETRMAKLTAKLTGQV